MLGFRVNSGKPNQECEFKPSENWEGRLQGTRNMVGGMTIYTLLLCFWNSESAAANRSQQYPELANPRFCGSDPVAVLSGQC